MQYNEVEAKNWGTASLVLLPCLFTRAKRMSARTEKCERFYHSKEWVRCRAAYRSSKNHTCEHCGKPGWVVHHKTPLNDSNVDNPSISLDYSNLMLLCPACHDAIHHRINNKAKGREEPTDRYAISFNENGDLTVKEKVMYQKKYTPHPKPR